MTEQDKLKHNILVVDDEKNICDLLQRHLKFLGYNVDTAENGKAALNLMENKKYSVVISDITMPVMNGIDLLRNIKKEYPMTHVIMITGYVTIENVLACMRHGADTCVFKPLEVLKELEDAVNYAIFQLNRWENKLLILLRMKP